MDEVWNEALPNDDTEASSIDDEIRKLKRAVRERVGIEHVTYVDETGTDDAYTHKRGTAKLEFGTHSNRPAVNPDQPGKIYVSVDKNSLMAYDNGTEWININEQYKVGDIYTTTHTQNPAQFFGYGTWEEFGEGKVLVGYNDSETEFNAIEKTGGEKEHSLTEEELPEHYHYLTNGRDTPGYASYTDQYLTERVSNGGSENYNLTSSTGEANKIRSGHVGADQPHNNIQPYIVVKMWKRTA